MNKLPAGWEIKKLKDVCTIQDGIHKTPKYTSKGIKFVSVENINDLYNNNKFISEEDYNKMYKIKAKKNDIFMTRIGDIGTPAILNKDEKLAYYVTLCLFTNIDEEVFNKYLYYAIQSNYFKKELYYRTLHVAFPKKINLGDIGDCKFILPPLDEQKRIASALSKIDAYLENTIKLIEEKERFKRGIAKKLLTCKEGENIPEARFKGFEDEWEETQILEFVNNNIIKIEKGKSITKSKIEEGDIPVIAGGKTPPYYHNKYDYNFPCITISASGSAGYVWFHDYKIWASDCHVIYTDNKRYNIKFLYHYLKNIQDLIYYLQVGGVQKHVYAKDLIKLNIPNITIEEQEKIGGYLSLLDEEIDNLKKQKELIKEMKRGAMQKLLSGEVRLLE
ncbi:restriction endonuclease subunit S [Brachyspira aalborgi]|uniref:Restriction endonuclease subunit S n=1 Tax=Brachyspira aalborgi TaxID=29522 RepID=A0A5C8D8L2_9SPIR|nr:restriction endonuclease subunit S [Brachyspira aalborgi]TXJ20811.1 restriction endonuclease subunit S [Brachyspira aalborgi]